MAGEPRRGASGLAGGHRAGQASGVHRPGLRRRLGLPEPGRATLPAGPGVSRSGGQRIGGICWMDWDELVPIPGLNQLVGHTPDKSVRHKKAPTSRNICLDTNLRNYAVFDGGKLEIKSYDALMVAAKAR